jgi:hypothetical protein
VTLDPYDAKFFCGSIRRPAESPPEAGGMHDVHARKASAGQPAQPGALILVLP